VLYYRFDSTVVRPGRAESSLSVMTSHGAPRLLPFKKDLRKLPVYFNRSRKNNQVGPASNLADVPEALRATSAPSGPGYMVNSVESIFTMGRIPAKTVASDRHRRGLPA
jgi:hypothetical protein